MFDGRVGGRFGGDDCKTNMADGPTDFSPRNHRATGATADEHCNRPQNRHRAQLQRHRHRGDACEHIG